MLRIGGLALVLAGACGSVSSDNPDAPAVADAAVADQTSGDASLGTFGTPVPLSELNTAGVTDGDPSLTFDQLEIYFSSRRDDPATFGTELYVAKRSGRTQPFQAPTRIAELSSPSDEYRPFVSGDGLTMHFTSTRVGGPGLTDIYVSTRASRVSAWGPAELVVGVNSAASEQALSLTADSRTAVLVSDRNGSRDFFVLTRSMPGQPWGVPATLTELNTPGAEQSAMIVAGGNAIYYARTEGDEIGLFVARRNASTDPFGGEQVLAELLGTSGRDSDLWVSEDERTVYFSSGRTGDDEIYMATR